MSLARIAERCYNITESYLNIPSDHSSAIINETKNAVSLTKHYLLDDIFPRWNPLNGAISFSYNGGKDCQVLLLLYLACLWEFFVVNARQSQYETQYHKFPMNELPTVFIDSKETFPSLESFIEYTQRRYVLSLYESKKDKLDPRVKQDMSDAFRRFLELFPETQAITIGVRHTDPFGEHLKPIQRTDSGWPDFYRLQPLLHWKLAHVWSFLLFSGEPICGLYGMGFTSIGDVDNTLPNPYLKKNKGTYDTESVCGAGRFMFEWEVMNSYRESNIDGGVDGSTGSRNDYDCDGRCSFRDNVNIFSIDKMDEEWLDRLGGSDLYYPGWCLTEDSLERAGRIKNSTRTQ